MSDIFKKVGVILGSVRFWIVSLTAVVAILEGLVAGTLTSTFVFDTVQIWLAAIVTIGTLDSVATKFGTTTTKKK